MIDYNEWRGKEVLDMEGAKVGVLNEIYVDDKTNEPAWATVKTGLFGSKENFFPVSLASVSGDNKIVVQAAGDQIRNAPKIDVNERLNNEEEYALYEYYQQDWGEDKPVGGERVTTQDGSGERGATDELHDPTAAQAAAAGTGAGAAAATRSRGEGTNRGSGTAAMDQTQPGQIRGASGSPEQELGRYRLRKYIVREEKTITVPVEREEVRLEPISDEEKDKGTPDSKENPQG